MPVMGGREATQMLRQWEQNKVLPSSTATSAPSLTIVALTATSMEKQEEDELKFHDGFDDILGKPFKQDQLKSLIDRVSKERKQAI